MKPFAKIRPRSPAPLFVTGALVQVFLVLALYLVIAYDSEPTLFSVPAGIQLPALTGNANSASGIRVESTREGYNIEGVGLEVERDRRGQVLDHSIKAMTTMLVKARRQNPDFDSILFVADSSLTFENLAPLMRSAEAAGLTRWNLLVAKAAP